jgi:protein-S-isoprenylcysteine O-methyltransferase Ste14
VTWRRQLFAALVLPGVVTIVVPALILAGTDRGFACPVGAAAGFRGAAGLVLAVVGLLLWAQAVSLFARVGEGTLAPWDPTRHLVVLGPYRRVRNPMISAVVSVLLGEALVLGSTGILVWALAFFLANAVYIPRFEEPGLVRRFGEEYRRYARHVPRWLPRLRPWEPD